MNQTLLDSEDKSRTGKVMIPRPDPREEDKKLSCCVTRGLTCSWTA